MPQSLPILFSTMIRTILPRTIPTLALKPSVSTTCSRRLFTNTALRHAKDPKMNTGPPKHEMVYFPDMTSALPSTSAEFRRVLWTGLYSQVVLMTVPVGGDIGDEVHTVDQALTFTSGTGKATIAGKDQDVKAGDLMVVPAGTQHQFVNTGPTPLVRNPSHFFPPFPYQLQQLITPPDPLHDLLSSRTRPANRAPDKRGRR